MNTPKAPIEKCPHCGSDDGFYTKQQARGSCLYYYNFDGSEYLENGSFLMILLLIQVVRLLIV